MKQVVEKGPDLGMYIKAGEMCELDKIVKPVMKKGYYND